MTFKNGSEEIAAIHLREDEFLMHQFSCIKCRGAICAKDVLCAEGQAAKDALDLVWNEVDPPVANDEEAQ